MSDGEDGAGNRPGEEEGGGETEEEMRRRHNKETRVGG